MAEDWEYSQRWEIQQVYENIYISSFKPAKDLNLLNSLGITAVLIIKDEKEHFLLQNFSENFVYLTVILENSTFVNLVPILKISNQFIQDSISVGGIWVVLI
jgi:serine/threonine/tyrosine-interacting protein